MSESSSTFRMRSTIDMGRGSSDRQQSKKAVSYLHEGDRRLKKTVVAPHMTSSGHPGEINGTRVTRKGKGLAPADKKEQQWSTNGKKHVPGKSFASNPNLLSSTPLTGSEKLTLTSSEIRSNFARKVSNRFNESSLSGSGMVPMSQAEFRPSRRPGSANGSSNMSKILSHSCEVPAAMTLRSHDRLAWTVAQRPNTADSIIRHRMEDPSTPAGPPEFGTRTMTPAQRTVNLEESRSCFLSSLSSYAANKVRGHYGSSSIASLAGL